MEKSAPLESQIQRGTVGPTPSAASLRFSGVRLLTSLPRKQRGSAGPHAKQPTRHPLEYQRLMSAPPAFKREIGASRFNPRVAISARRVLHLRFPLYLSESGRPLRREAAARAIHPCLRSAPFFPYIGKTSANQYSRRWFWRCVERPVDSLVGCIQ